MNKLILTIALLAACSDQNEASRAVVGAGAHCVTRNGESFCVYGDKLYACLVDGLATFTAECRVVGNITPVLETK